jgi:glycosyltransferase involved in cell wall biosynthesis
MSPVSVPDEPSERDGRGLVFVGRLSREKGFPDLLEALGTPPASEVPWHLDVLGTAPSSEAESEHRRILSRHPRSGDIVLHGMVEGEAKLELLSRGSIMILPTYVDVFPVVLLEALSYGMAVISTGVGEIPSIMTGRGGGWREVPPGSPGALSAAVSDLLADPGGIRAMGARNLLLAETFSIVRVSTVFAGILTELAERRTGDA